MFLASPIAVILKHPLLKKAKCAKEWAVIARIDPPEAKRDVAMTVFFSTSLRVTISLVVNHQFSFTFAQQGAAFS